MKKIFAIVSLLICFFAADAQRGGPDSLFFVHYKHLYGEWLSRGKFDSVLLVPPDTLYSKDGVAIKNGTMYTGDHTRWSVVSVAATSTLTRAAVTSGITFTVPGGNYLVSIDYPTVDSSLSITFPASPADQDEVQFEVGGTITSGSVVTFLSFFANTGQGIIWSSPIFNYTAVAGEWFRFRYRASNAKWYAHY